jgi:ATP-dependent protease ClpP protease subunit
MSENSMVNVINFFGDITEKTINALLKILCDIENADSEKTSKIVIRLSSSGGVLGYAKQAYRILREYPKERLTIHNMGSIESAAMIFYLAAKTRTAIPGSRFLIHPLCWTYIPPKITLPELEKAKKELENDIECYAHIFEQNTKFADNPIDIRKYLVNHSYDLENKIPNLEKDTFIINANEALSLGITTETPIEFITPAGAVYSVVTDS